MKSYTRMKWILLSFNQNKCEGKKYIFPKLKGSLAHKQLLILYLKLCEKCKIIQIKWICLRGNFIAKSQMGTMKMRNHLTSFLLLCDNYSTFKLNKWSLFYSITRQVRHVLSEKVYIFFIVFLLCCTPKMNYWFHAGSNEYLSVALKLLLWWIYV